MCQDGTDSFWGDPDRLSCQDNHPSLNFPASTPTALMRDMITLLFFDRHDSEKAHSQPSFDHNNKTELDYILVDETSLHYDSTG